MKFVIPGKMSLLACWSKCIEILSCCATIQETSEDVNLWSTQPAMYETLLVRCIRLLGKSNCVEDDTNFLYYLRGRSMRPIPTFSEIWGLHRLKILCFYERRDEIGRQRKRNATCILPSFVVYTCVLNQLPCYVLFFNCTLIKWWPTIMMASCALSATRTLKDIALMVIFWCLV